LREEAQVVVRVLKGMPNRLGSRNHTQLNPGTIDSMQILVEEARATNLGSREDPAQEVIEAQLSEVPKRAKPNPNSLEV
jgi:hypothetical protein